MFWAPYWIGKLSKVCILNRETPPYFSFSSAVNTLATKLDSPFPHPMAAYGSTPVWEKQYWLCSILHLRKSVSTKQLQSCSLIEKSYIYTQSSWKMPNSIYAWRAKDLTIVEGRLTWKWDAETRRKRELRENKDNIGRIKKFFKKSLLYLES